MILIADGGSTKCDWIAVDEAGKTLFKTRTKGVNPALLTKKEVVERLAESPELLTHHEEVGKVFFYGAGCGLEKQQKGLAKAFRRFFTKASVVDVKEDLAAAVYACTDKPAVVCILGTGSNCCYFDGTEIQTRMPALGYTLMDDASGNFIGKQLLRAYYFKQMPEYLADKFRVEYQLDPAKVKKNLYKKPNPNAYLATFAKFLFENIEEPFSQALLKEAALSFLKSHLMLFKEELASAPVHFIGSIAYYAKEQITEVLKEHGIQAGKFVRRPIDGLVSYHTTKVVS
ncbi:N-acetylglucosamine kinase [Zhouia spongiae]|uniref:N-acetylglucosamine kinase n=1 Tax=Zhouia spongiae TaxID=2202721 RepID=A0ABY3YMZ3_9FLAO|nr:BadF/BadG/BcrA/BcrD ATPase family protein [Zhouia spongiae]UNY99187.1 N-acetylglucosamine kinase [Zhouia spongiae]